MPAAATASSIALAPEDGEAEVQASVSIDVWLVDDNQRMRDTMKELFERCPGIRCTGAFHSPNAVLSALASRIGPDVILLDMHLGDHNGLDAIRPIKSLSRTTHVMMFTTFFDPHCRERALMSGATDFLLKSFPLEKIITSIRQTWRMPAPHPRKRLVVPPAAGIHPSPEGADSSSMEVGAATERVGVTPPARRRLAWVKNCLDLIRGAQS